jgi:Leucine-rich repeat (LRR) protein
VKEQAFSAVACQAEISEPAGNLLLPVLGVADNVAMQADPQKPDSPPRRRRKFQFSLRTLLIFTVVCAIAAGRLGKRIEQKRHEHEAVNEVLKSGGSVAYDFVSGEPSGPAWLRSILGENFFNEVVQLKLSGYEVTDQVCGNIKEFAQLENLRLSDSSITDAGLANFYGLTHLRQLELVRIDVTASCVENLKRLADLQILNLEGSHLNGTALANLQGLSQLTEVQLDRVLLFDDGLWSVRPLSQLTSLSLQDTQLTDAGLNKLKALTQLRNLDLTTNRVSDAGVADLQRALPQCKIVH